MNTFLQGTSGGQLHNWYLLCFHRFRFPKILGCDYRGILSSLEICLFLALGSLHFRTSQGLEGKEESQPVLGMA